MSEHASSETRAEMGTAGDDWKPAPAVPSTATRAPMAMGTHEQPAPSLRYGHGGQDCEQLIALLARLVRRAATQEVAEKPERQ